MILIDGDLDIGSSFDRLHESLEREDVLDSLWPWDQSMETSAMSYPGMLLDCLEDSKHQLVKNDVVLSECLGDQVSRLEHSYSCSIASDGDSVPSSPLSLDLQDDMESECFPCIPMKKASQDSGYIKDQGVYIKSEPLSPTPSQKTTYSPTTTAFHGVIKQELDPMVQIKQESITIISKPSQQHHQYQQHQQQQQSLLKTSPTTTRILCPKVSLKLEDVGCLGSVSSLGGGTGSLAGSNVIVSRQRLVPATRQTISSPLISTQLKGSSGVIYLTEEEKRTLISEGYPIPTKLPLSKAEERSLKKIRRKIKNKISAQESRRKKKEYMDSLERKYDILQNEANMWRSKAEALQTKNVELMKQLGQLEERVKRAEGGGINPADITYILPVEQSIEIRSTSLQDKGERQDYEEISPHCLDIDVD